MIIEAWQPQGVSRPKNTFNEWLQEPELVRTPANESRGLTLAPGHRRLGSEVFWEPAPLPTTSSPVESWAHVDLGGSWLSPPPLSLSLWPVLKEQT